MFIRYLAFAMTLILMAGTALAAAPAAPAKAPKPKRTPPAVIETPQGPWATQITPGLDSNLSKDNATLVLISANWCPYCKTIKKTVFPDAGVQESLKNWKCVYIDLDTYPQMGPELKTRTIPFFALFDKNGQEVSRFNHEMTDPKEFKAWIDDVRAKIDEQEKIEAALKAKPGDAKLLASRANNRIAIALKLQATEPAQVVANTPERIDAAIAAANEALAADGANADLKKNVEFMETVKLILANDPGATPKLDAFAKANSGNPFGADAAFWQTVVSAKQGRIPSHTQVQMYAEYLKQYPNSRFSDTARLRIASLNTSIEKARKAKEKAAAKAQAAKK